MATVNPQMINEVVKLSSIVTKSKKSSIALLILIVALAIIQFILPIAEKDGTNINSFQALQYNSYHWAFNYFYFIILVAVLGIILLFLSKKKEISCWYDFSLWTLSFIGLLTFMIALQGFLKKTTSLGIQDNALNGVVSFFIIGICAFIAIGKLFNQYEKIAEKTKEKMLTSDFKQAIKNKKIIYENTIHLNPKWYVTMQHPDPIKMAVTDKEIIISSIPLTKIPLQNVKSVTLNSLYQMALRVNCKDGKKYKIMWAPANKAAPYILLETQDIKENLNRILKKAGFV